MASRIDADVEDEEDYEPKKRRNFFDDVPTQDSRGTFDAPDFVQPSFESHMEALGLGGEYLDKTETVDWAGNVAKSSTNSMPIPNSNYNSKPPRPSNPPVQSARGTVNSSRAPSHSTTTESISLSNGGMRFSKSSSQDADTLSLDSTSSLKSSKTSYNEMTHRRSSSATIVEKPKMLDSPSPSLPSADSSSSIEDAVRRETKPSIAEIARLQAEIHTLNRKIKTLNKTKWTPLSIADTVTRMIEGEPYSLEHYRSLRDKLSLLDATIGYHDGNAILSVVIFMKRTLSKNLFYEEMRKRPSAVNQYVAFLKMQNDDAVVSEMRALGRMNDAAISKFKTAREIQDPRRRLKALMDCQEVWFSLRSSLELETQMITEYITLLNKQILIDSADAKAQEEGHPRFRERPRKVSLYFQPLITSLFYCCLYHFQAPETHASSPLAFKTDFPLTEKQYLFTALRARSLLKKWDDLEPLLTTKNWRGKAKLKAAVKFEHVVEILFSVNAPEDEIRKYCKLIEDTDSRLQIAKRYKSHIVVIDTLASMKDRQQLEHYKNQIVQNPDAENHLEMVLRNPNNKWKN